MYKVFIDGSAGTTGLQIRERLAARPELELLEIKTEYRKDLPARLSLIAEADVAFLCLPDAAAAEIAEAAAGIDTVLIDTSTAHRTSPGWVYGFPELHGQRALIAQAKRIANPGCHATGFIALVAPLVEAGLIPPDAVLNCVSLTGYSGGGKSMIAAYEADGRDALLSAPRLYALGQSHKHIPEMLKYTGLSRQPVFCPVVSDYYAGMETLIQLDGTLLKQENTQSPAAAVEEIYFNYYGESDIIKVQRVSAAGGGDGGTGFLSAGAYAGRDTLELAAWGSDGCVVLTARFDNLGKGASGAAIQNMNIVLGLDETAGLTLTD